MTGIEVYKKYIALKLHFEQADYDYLEYGGNAKIPEERYFRLFNKFLYEKIAQQVPHDEIELVFINLFLDEIKIENLTYNEIMDRYRTYKNRFSSLSFDIEYYLKSISNKEEHFVGKNEKTHAQFVKDLIVRKITPEHFIIIDSTVKASKVYDEIYVEPIWQRISFSMKKYKTLLINIIDIEKAKSLRNLVKRCLSDGN